VGEATRDSVSPSEYSPNCVPHTTVTGDGKRLSCGYLDFEDLFPSVVGPYWLSPPPSPFRAARHQSRAVTTGDPGVFRRPASARPGRERPLRLGLPCPWVPLQSTSAAASLAFAPTREPERHVGSSHGVLLPSTTSAWAGLMAVCLTATFRSQRFSRSQRFLPARTSQPCFMLQPSLGFRSPACSPPTKPQRLSAPVAPLPLLPRLPAFTRLRGLAPGWRPFPRVAVTLALGPLRS